MDKKKDELYSYFLDGIAMVVALYEICRMGASARQRPRKRNDRNIKGKK